MADKGEILVSQDLPKGEGSQFGGFLGSFTHAIDEKGRVSFPSPFRAVLLEKGESQVVLTNFISDGARCLEGFALSEWRAFEAKLSQKSRFDPKLRKLENFYLARASLCTVDSSGRINIASHLRTYAGFEKDVVFTSTLNGFRIWERRVWELIFKEAETALLEDPSLFADIDL